MNKASILMLTLVAVASGVAQAAGNAERGKVKADQVCAACHSVQGNWNKTLQPDQPKLATAPKRENSSTFFMSMEKSE